MQPCPDETIAVGANHHTQKGDRYVNDRCRYSYFSFLGRWLNW